MRIHGGCVPSTHENQADVTLPLLAQPQKSQGIVFTMASMPRRFKGTECRPHISVGAEAESHREKSRWVGRERYRDLRKT